MHTTNELVFNVRLNVCRSVEARPATGSRFQSGSVEMPKACLPITHFATCSLSVMLLCYYWQHLAGSSPQLKRYFTVIPERQSKKTNVIIVSRFSHECGRCQLESFTRMLDKITESKITLDIIQRAKILQYEIWTKSHKKQIYFF